MTLFWHQLRAEQLTFWRSREAATTVCITAAAPAMSSFIVSMPAAGLIDRPPESKVIPLPTRARCLRPFARPDGV